MTDTRIEHEVGGLDWNAADLKNHPAACPEHVTEKLRDAALTLGLSIQVGARKLPDTVHSTGQWERYIEVTDERLPAPFDLEKTVLRAGESWEDAARRIGLWPTR